MEKSTLVEILRTFSKDELTSFGDLAASPYFNKKTNVTKLCKALNKFAPSFPAQKRKCGSLSSQEKSIITG